MEALKSILTPNVRDNVINTAAFNNVRKIAGAPQITPNMDATNKQLTAILSELPAFQNMIQQLGATK